MNIPQQSYYFRELQRRQSLLRAYNNLLQTQKVGLSAEEPVTFSSQNAVKTVQNIPVQKVSQVVQQKVVEQKPVETK